MTNSIIALILALALLGLTLAFVFNSSFRRDLLKGDSQEFSFLGFSIKGVAIIVFSGLLVFLEWHVLKISSDADESARASNPLTKLNFLPDDQEQAIQQIRQKHQDSIDYHALLERVPAKDGASVLKELTALRKQSEQLDIVKAVENLSMEDSRSAEIRGMAARRVGPWALSGSSVEVRLTVPGTLPMGTVRGCPQQKGNHYELTSALAIDGNDIRADAVYVTVDEKAGVISRAQDCQQKYDFLQVSCDIAHRIFTERALVCDKGQAKWNPGVDQRPPALAVQVNEAL